MTSAQEVRKLQEAVWNGSLPLDIRLHPGDSRVYDKTDPYLIHCPRISYLPFLLPRLHAFFSQVLIDPSVSPSAAWFSFENVPLKWHLPLGLLYDLFSGAPPYLAPSPHGRSKSPQGQKHSTHLPWRLIVHYSSFPSDQLVRLDDEGKALHDAFINTVKEADFLRNGTAKAIMTLSKDDSTTLWEAVTNHDLAAFTTVNNKLLPPLSSLRHIPIRFYLPTTDYQRTDSPKPPSYPNPSAPSPKPASGHIKVIQSLVPPLLPNSREAQTLGTALHSVLPSLFPSRRTPILARPILHGGVVPMSVSVELLMRGAAYADGWVSCGVEMLG